MDKAPRYWFAAVATALFCLASAPSGAVEQFASAKEAEVMVAKAVKHIKEAGKDKALADFMDKNGGYIDRDLYITVYNMNGRVLAHGANPKMVGKDLIDLKDVDGKPFVRERMELAKSKQTFWQDYKFTDPITKKVLPKSMYCERTGDMVVCGGVYKR